MRTDDALTCTFTPHARQAPRSLGFEILTMIPDAFHHPVEGYVGLHIVHRPL